MNINTKIMREIRIMDSIKLMDEAMKLACEDMNLKETDILLGVAPTKTSLRNKIKLYKKRAEEVERFLKKNPGEWGRFQTEFNMEINSIFTEIMNFEKVNKFNGNDEKVQKLKEFFLKKFQHMFVKGEYFKKSFDKPYGYSGDFKIIDDIYINNPTSTGFERLFDNYFQMSSISIAVRNRKEDFKRIISDFLNRNPFRDIKIMSLASGPCREIKELLSQDNLMTQNIAFDCYDNDENSFSYAKELLEGHKNVNFIKENAVKLGLTKNVEKRIGRKYDIIYSTGLFDYLNYKLSVRLVANLRELLAPNGILAISDVRDKYSNPSSLCMELVGEWELLYRTDDEFRQIFIDAGFKVGELTSLYEQQGIMQYIIAAPE